MKKTLIILMILSVVVASFISTAYADFVNGEKAYEYMKDFCTMHPYRSSETESVKDAEQYIKDKFVSFGYTDAKILNEFKYSYDYIDYTSRNAKSISGNGRNVEAIKKSSSSNGFQIIIGAHLDNEYKDDDDEIIGAQGVVNNGCGIGMLLALSEYFSDKDIGVDIRFVAFGSKLIGLYGSNDYINDMTEEEISKTLLYINLDSFITGDNLYVYCDELPTLHESLFLNSANSKSLELETMPMDKKALSISYVDSLPYSHRGLLSDNAEFLNAGIRSINFFSGNFDKINFIESSVHASMIGTKNDNITKLEERYGNLPKQRMDAVFTVVTDVLTREENINALKNTVSDPRLFVLSKWYPFVLLLGIALITSVVMLLSYKKTPSLLIDDNKDVSNGGGDDNRNIFDEFNSSNNLNSDKKPTKVFEEFDI